MRARHFVVAIAAAAVETLLVATGSAHVSDSLNNPVRITDSTCDVGYKQASHIYTRVVFGVFNLGTVAHGFDIGGPYKSGLIQPGQERTLVAHLPRSGAYKWACVSKHSTVKRGVFVIHPG
jgi:hypothetical protein